MKELLKISAVCITLNEAKTVENYIKSLWFVDEIILVDSYSTDDTVELAKKYSKVTIFKREFDNFSSQKNFAISKAKNDWVVFFDLDEEVTEKLADEIVQLFQTKTTTIAYKVRRNVIFMGKCIKFSGFQNDYVIRFFNKNYCYYNNLVHEILLTNGKTSKLKNNLPHHTYDSFNGYISKLKQYSVLQAEMLFEKNVKPTFYHFLYLWSYWKFSL